MGCMATMHFHIAQTGLFVGILFSHLGGPRERFGTKSKLSLWCKVGQIRFGVVGLRPKSVYLWCLFIFSPFFIRLS